MKYDFTGKSLAHAVKLSLHSSPKLNCPPEHKLSARGSVDAPIDRTGRADQIRFSLSYPVEVTLYHSCDGYSRYGYVVEIDVPGQSTIRDGVGNCPGTGQVSFWLPAGQGYFSVSAEVGGGHRHQGRYCGLLDFLNSPDNQGYRK